MGGFYRPLSEVAQDHVAWATSDVPRIPTGFPFFDERTHGGVATGEVLLFTARSQVGKTVWACNVVNNNCPLPTVFFSLEMHARYIAARLAAIHSDVPKEPMEAQLRKTGHCWPLDKIVHDFPHLAVVDQPGMSMKQMQQALNEVEEAWGGVRPKLVVIDFLELIGGVPSLSAVERIDKVTFQLKGFARRNDCALIILHQVGRGAGGPGAEPLDIVSAKYGGEVAADYVMGAYRPCLRKDITQREFLNDRWYFYQQFLKTRGGSETHPEGVLHQLHPQTLRLIPWPDEGAKVYIGNGDIPTHEQPSLRI